MTHALQLSPENSHLLIASGPGSNIDPSARDPSSGRSQVRSFSLQNDAAFPISFLDGTLVSYGIRNPAGFAFSPLYPNKLFVVENGASIDNVTGLTAAFVNDNPADEANVIDLTSSAASYGFPDCTTMWNGSADPIGDPQYVGFNRGDQFSLLLEGDRDTTWCENANNNRPPMFAFQVR